MGRHRRLCEVACAAVFEAAVPLYTSDQQPALFRPCKYCNWKRNPRFDHEVDTTCLSRHESTGKLQDDTCGD